MTLDNLIEFIATRAADARRSAANRIEMARDWKTETNADFKQAQILAQLSTGRKMPYYSRGMRKQLSAHDTNIAMKYQREAEMFEAVLVILQERTSA